MKDNEFSGLFPVSDLDASVRVPGSKSITNRALLVAALAHGPSTLEHVLFADDTHRMLEALEHLGVGIHQDVAAERVRIEGTGGVFRSPGTPLHVGNAGTAMRFLLAALCASAGGPYVLTGDPRMCERPLGDLATALQELGASIEYEKNPGYPPVRILGGGLEGGVVRLRAEKSSQYISALLLAGPLTRTSLKIEVVSPLVSRPYVDLTLDLMEKFGVSVDETSPGAFSVSGERGYQGRNFEIESDASSASYFLAAAAICGGRVRVEGVGTNSKQGDARFARILARMGCEVIEEPNAIEVRSSGKITAVDVDMNDMPDVALTLAPVAAFARGITRVRNVHNLRIKESDRIHAICNELRKTGIRAEEKEDGFEIEGGLPMAASIETYDDHRIAMTFSLLGLRTAGITILDPGCVAKTFPDFFERLIRVARTGRGAGPSEVTT